MVTDGGAPGRSLLAQAAAEHPTLAAAVVAGDVRLSCGMGVCYQCEREVAGVVVRTCLLRSRDD